MARPRINKTVRTKVTQSIAVESIQVGIEMAKMDFNKKYLPRIKELMAQGMEWSKAKKFAVMEIDLFNS